LITKQQTTIKIPKKPKGGEKGCRAFPAWRIAGAACRIAAKVLADWRPQVRRQRYQQMRPMFPNEACYTAHSFDIFRLFS